MSGAVGGPGDSGRDQRPKKPSHAVRTVDRKRIVFVACGVFVLFCVLLIQFYRIQILERGKWLKEAQGQHYFLITEPFKRGTFYSNTSLKKGNPETPQAFAVDIQKFHLYVDPQSVPDTCRDAIAQALMTFVGLPEASRAEFRSEFDIKSRSRKLAMWLDPEIREAILKWWQPYARKNKIPANAIYFVSDYQRSYPFGKMLGQVLHTVQKNKDEITKQAVPTGGLELQFNKYLKGQLGKRRLMRSPRNSLETGEVIESPKNGADIYLTINHCLQAIAEEEIAKGVVKSKARSGWAVMMDPRTGEILALAQYPSFDLSKYEEYFNDSRRSEDTRSKAITDANEPGSTMKAITLSLTLKANKERERRGASKIMDPSEKVAVSSGHFPGRRDITDTHHYNFLNMDMATQKSSNIYMARMAERVVNALGKEWYRQQLTNVFALGSKTGIELPSESPGMVPTPGKLHPNGKMEWSLPTPFSLAIGHNILLNSIQTVRAYAVLANGGYLVQPTLVRRIVKTRADGTEEVLLDNTVPERVRSFPKVLDDDIVEQVVTAMRFVTKSGGTATRADIPGYTEAGKTSSARKIVDGQYSNKKLFSTFIGFAPVNNPAFVLLVAMDEPEISFIPGVGPAAHGGVCAAPVFREIGLRALQYLGVAPDDPYGYPVGDPRRDADRSNWTKEVRELAKLYHEWNG